MKISDFIREQEDTSMEPLYAPEEPTLPADAADTLTGYKAVYDEAVGLWLYYRWDGERSVYYQVGSSMEFNQKFRVPVV